MTNEKHIEQLKKLRSFHNGSYGRSINKAIESLKQEPCREIEDYENEIEDLHNRLDIAEYDKERYREEITNLEEKIKALEQETKTDTWSIKDVADTLVKHGLIVEQEPKTGHWIRWYEQKETEWYIENIPHCKCSECGKEYDPHSSQFIKYCNECGARMVEPQESEMQK